MQKKIDTGMHPQLRPYIPIVFGLAAILGGDCEILLHDVGQLERSIVACANEHVTGRPLGSPMTAYGLQLLNSGTFEDGRDVHIYMARANNGALIKCGVICLRSEAGEIIGLLCIHFDTAKAQIARELLESLFAVAPGTSGAEAVNEFFGLEIEDVFRSALIEIEGVADAPLYVRSKAEKIEIVRRLMERGFFLMKGAVEYVAAEMGNSKFTIYAYMREAEKGAGRAAADLPGGEADGRSGGEREAKKTGVVRPVGRRRGDEARRGRKAVAEGETM